jgi:hypothetical protein
LVVPDLAVAMIVHVDDDGMHRLTKVEDHIIKLVLIADQEVLDNMGLKVLIEDSQVNLLLSQSVLASKVASLLHLELNDAAIGRKFNDWLQNVDTTGR